MWYDTPITSKLMITYPIIQAGMAGGVTTPELVASVSNAGGLGSLGAGYMTPAQMQKAIRDIKRLTTKPFAVNLFIPEDDRSSEESIANAQIKLQYFEAELDISDQERKRKSYLEAQMDYQDKLQVIMDEGVPVCSFTFGVPSKEDVSRLKTAEMILIGTATTVEEARMNEERGLDMVVLQGMEAGGHRGTFKADFQEALIGIASLIPQAVDAVSIPVIAAGGIMDGRGVLSMLALGADAVQMGTAFVTCQESGAHPLHQHAILTTKEDQTVITSVFSGKPARGIKNDFITRMAGLKDLPGYPTLNTLTKDIRKQAAIAKRPEWMSLWSGQSSRLSTTKSAREIIHDSVQQVNAILKRLSTS
ncbi:NAD(P)H-dependent flavin oxidoreductase [Guptibacillus spartinae]|uniref:NAD(P)H-dependent flavin oxidoreductase n=1 Tax=Guptibacillus spartinae TaxID=3025679 RepID=UPI0023629FD4|nr:nitronate monooxygenase [Pseudalkalibacillus spartinae]